MEVLPLFARLFGMRLYVHPQGRSVTESERRSTTVIPDMILNGLETATHRFVVVSGMEVKRAKKSKWGASMVNTILQAQDQVKSLVYERRLSNETSHLWIVAEGPNFMVRRLGPYSDRELTTAFAKATDSGDYGISRKVARITAHRGTAERPLKLANIGTRKGARLMAAAMEEMVASCPGGVRIDTKF